MKKGSLIILILILIASIFISGKLYLNRKKPSNYYYTNLLAKNLTICSKCEAKILDTNFYKTESLSSDDIQTIKNFLSELKKSNFITKPVSIKEKAKYRYFFTFPETKEKYIINVYSTDYVSIHPWDGDFPVDCISTTTIPKRYNLYGLSIYVFSKEPNFD
ncbi:DUF4883 family protein [Clostridium aestuarii]|uniref:DUF4883 family protein n=1 Tax=Clostridium aestuarii TaxID=338193 RepID=A0ABT4D597_9CLOT|nr:DUF4883 family protein [Clostridium aestuarii]MCY6485812.1 DUF4883 family protein [Clostridium aestuarii]